MICTFGDQTDVIVVARTEPAGPQRSWAATVASCPWSGTTPKSQARYDELAGKQHQAGAEAHRRDAARVGRPGRRPEADQPRREVLGERQQPARDRHDPAVVHQVPAQGRRCCQRADELELPPRVHAACACRTGSRVCRATGTSRASASSACRSRFGIRSTPTARSTGTRRSRRDPTSLPVDPSTDAPPGFTRRAAQPTGRLHRRPRRDGHVGHVVDEPRVRVGLGARRRPVRARVPDGPAPAGATTSSGRGSSTQWCAARCSSGTLPFKQRHISGFVTDPDRKKLSKSTSERRRQPLRPHRASTAPTPCATGRAAPSRAATPPSIRTNSRSVGASR